MCGRVVRPLCVVAWLTTLAGCCSISSTPGMGAAMTGIPPLPVLTSLQRLEHNGTPGVWMDSRDAGALALWIRTTTGGTE